MSRLLALLIVFAAGCADTGRSFVSVAFSARGAPTNVATIDGWDITLTRADVAVGPIYFCATALASSELCEDALLESRETHLVNGIDATAQDLGVLTGVTGTVRSTAYDFGWSFFLTHTEAMPTEGAVSGHSAILEGQATKGLDTFTFRFEVDVIPQLVGDTAIQGQKTMHEVTGEGHAATLVVDPMVWLDAVDFDAVFALPHAPGTAVVVTRGMEGHDALVLGMTSFAPPTFEWSAGPD